MICSYSSPYRCFTSSPFPGGPGSPSSWYSFRGAGHVHLHHRQVATAAVQLDGLHVHRQVATAAVQALRRYTDGRPSPSRSPSSLATIQVVAVLLREQPGEDPVRVSQLLK